MKERVYSYLKEQGLPFAVTEHPAVFTMEDMHAQGLAEQGTLCKNLFVRDAKGKQHFLVVAHVDTTVDLKSLGEKLNAGKLSFASAQRLESYLGAATGAVSPLCLLWDTAQAVTLVLDEALRGAPRLGIHPNDNTATLWISWDNLLSFAQGLGNTVRTLSL